MRMALAALAMMFANNASAQTFSYAPLFDPLEGNRGGLLGPPFINGGNSNNTTDYIQVERFGGSALGTQDGFGYISLSQFATSTTAQSDARNSIALAAIAARMDRMSDRFREGIALAGAINVLPPNPGDRFTISFGGAGYDGTGAASVSISARIDESTLAYLGYARGPTQNFVKGGVGFSFR